MTGKMGGRACSSPKAPGRRVGKTARLAASTIKNISKTARAEGLQKSELTLLFLEE